MIRVHLVGMLGVLHAKPTHDLTPPHPALAVGTVSFRHAHDEMSEESAEPGLTPEEWRSLARKHVLVRGLLRMRQAGAGADPDRFWEERRWSIRLT